MARKKAFGEDRPTDNTRQNVAWLALVMSVLSFGASLITFWYINLSQGKLVFSRPNIAYVEHRKEGRIVVAFPVTITNTGAVVHTVNTLTLHVRRKNSTWERDLKMFAEFDSFPASRITFASGFALAPRSSSSKIVGFLTDGAEQLPQGTYECSLSVYKDESVTPTGPVTKFNVLVSEDGLRFIKQKGWFVNYGAYFVE